MKKKHPIKIHYPIILVQWIDAASMSDVGWKTEEDVDEFLLETPWLITDVGFLKADTEDYICLIGGYGPVLEDYNLTCHRELKIPKGCIVRKIKVPVP